MEEALGASEFSEPEYFRYPFPLWVDFENHIYEREEVGMVIQDLEDESVVLLIGKPGSGKTVLLQMVGYQLKGNFSHIFYEDLADYSEKMLEWHHSTEHGDEYRLNDCLNTLSTLAMKSGKNSNVLVILDNCHRYANFLRHFRNLGLTRIPERVCLLLAMRPTHMAIQDELEDLQSGFSGPFRILSVPTMLEGMDAELDSGMRDLSENIERLLKDSHRTLLQGQPKAGQFTEEEKGFLAGGMAMQCQRSTLESVQGWGFPCRELSDARTEEVVIEILGWTLQKAKLVFKDEEAGERWFRFKVGSSISLLTFLLSSLVSKDHSIEFDKESFCAKVLRRFSSLEEDLVSWGLSSEVSEGALRRVFNEVVKTLGWFTYLDVQVPESYLLDENVGLLGNVDKRLVSTVLNHLSKQREILRSRSGDLIYFSLPYQSLGTVVLECMMGCKFPPESKDPNASVLTQMALQVIHHLRDPDAAQLLVRLGLYAQLDHLVELPLVCEYLQDVEVSAKLLIKGILLPGFLQQCSSITEQSDLPKTLANLISESDSGAEIELLIWNTVTPGMVDVLLDKDVVEAIAAKIENRMMSSPFVMQAVESSMLWHIPRIKDAVISRARELASSLDSSELDDSVFLVLNLMPAVVKDEVVLMPFEVLLISLSGESMNLETLGKHLLHLTRLKI